MPAKTVTDRDRILKAAMRIVKKRGMDGLNMRAVAKECGCSTQPLYHCFSGMPALKEAVAAQIVQIYQGFLRDEIASGEFPEYKAVGMGYIRFAKEEPQLFKYLFMRDRHGSDTIDEDTGFEEEALRIAQKTGVDERRARELHAHMWVWVHGIAAMYATGYLSWDRETVSRMLTDVFLGVKQRLEE